MLKLALFLNFEQKWASCSYEIVLRTKQARRHGGHSEAVPPKWLFLPPQTKIVPPPQRGLCPKEINRLGATGVQIEALDSQNSAYRPRICELELFFVIFVDSHRISWNFAYI